MYLDLYRLGRLFVPTSSVFKYPYSKRYILTFDSEDLRERRMNRHRDAAAKLAMLLLKKQRFGEESNIYGIQGVRVRDIIIRDSVSFYLSGQASRTPEDFSRAIPTKELRLEESLREMIGIAKNEELESGFLVLHREGGQ